MKATGIVRRIDDLGRVVIPKEIRRTLRIREGDPLEIFTTGEGEVIFKKYSPIGELGAFAGQYAEVLAKHTGLTVLVCDRDHIVAAAGPARKDYADKRVGQPLERVMEHRLPYQHGGAPADCLYPCEGAARHILLAVTIVAGGDVVGAVAALAEDKQQAPDPVLEKLLAVAAAFLGRQMED